MPFDIFCLHCDGHIGQGVRFNAEKKKIGKYYSTPIFSFRMRHVSCSGWIEIQTDPKNTAYVVTEGAKKRSTADEDGGDAAVRDIRNRDPALLDDPFAMVEKGVADKMQAKQGAERIAELRGLSDRQWQDPWEHSRKMRRVFRVRRSSPPHIVGNC
jgi:coiled-coil domain-containing protein 130